MKQEWIWKTVILLVAVLVVGGVWFAIQTIDRQAAAIDKLEETIRRQEDQIDYLENSYQTQTEEVRDSAEKEIAETVRVFVTSVFQVTEDNYEERRTNAKTVMTSELYEEVFPDGENRQLLYEYGIDDMDIYPVLDGEKAKAFVTFTSTVKNQANGTEESTPSSVQAFVKETDEGWKIYEFKQMKNHG